MNFATRLLEPHLDSSVAIRSIVAIGGARSSFAESGGTSQEARSTIGAATAVLLRPSARGSGAMEATTINIDPASRSSPRLLIALAEAVGHRCGTSPGVDVLLVTADDLQRSMTPVADDFAFAAVVVHVATSERGGGENERKLRRDLFDRGLVGVASSSSRDGTAYAFLASGLVARPGASSSPSRNLVTVSTLGSNGRFGNQLFQYSYAKLYALRHGATAAFPDWEGQHLYGLDDPACPGEPLERWSFAGFTDDDRKLWEWDDPPVDIDLKGYFQETPPSWRRHRPWLRRLFGLSAERTRAVDAWRRRVTDEGRRTLVAIHVRRGDYRRLQRELPYFRLVPEAWYLEWLRGLWPTLRDPVLFIATDEPDAIRPAFDEFESVSAGFGPPADALPAHVREFEAMRRADHLAICNSSFSRMAAILASDDQRCYVPSLRARAFVPYEPWIDPAFWTRFGATDDDTDASGTPRWRPAAATMVHRQLDGPERSASILLDVSDLVRYVADHATLTGIQRVHSEIVRHLLAIPQRPSIRLVVLDHRDELAVVDASVLVAVLEGLSAGKLDEGEARSRMHSLLERSVPCAVRSRDVFLTVGAFWGGRRIGRLLQQLKDARVIVGALIHDLLPIDTPEFFEAGSTSTFVKSVVEALTFADFTVTASEYNRASLVRFMADRGLDRVPVHLLPLARERANGALGGSIDSPLVKELLGTDYVLCVGTIEVRKNPAYLFQVWKLMVASGRRDVPTLVFAGRRGWLVRDLLDQLESCRYLDGRIVIVHDASDVELDALYRHCLLTMFPSFAEGWGLPVGESLAHGKICLCSATGGIPEAGGAAADYLDPYDARDGVARLTRYLDDPELRRRREREIVGLFEPRTWRNVADALLTSTLALARQVRAVNRAAAVRLPAERFLSISSDAATFALDAADGSLSADLACVSGWHPSDVSGIRAAGPEAALRFRTSAPEGSGIVVVLRLAAHAGPLRLRMRAGNGADADVSIAFGTEGVGVLACQVEAGQQLTVHLSSVAEAGEPAGPCAWTLRGFMYFEPTRVGTASGRAMASESADRPVRTSVSSPDSEVASRTDITGDRSHVWLSASLSMYSHRQASSFGEFLSSTNAWWPSESATRLDPPIVADDADARAFVAGRANGPHAGPVGRDAIKLVRRSEVFVSMARFSEGSIFDASGVWRAMGYLQGAPRGSAPWLSSGPNGLRIDAQAMAAAPFHDASCVVFYNGNLHNYYHWVAEGLLGLDLLTRALGPDARRRILLPRSVDIAAVFDHRRSLADVGLGGQVEEVAADLVRVREAVWVDSDLVQAMPAPYLKDFQQRVFALHASRRRPEKRRLLIARRGPARTIANHAPVQAALSKLGFETVYLEGMNVADQILLFQGAEFIVGPHGAGLANLLFCEPGTKVIEFMPSIEFRPFFWLISEKLDLVHGILFCPTTAGQGFQGALGVDVGKLQALVRMVDAASATVPHDGRAARATSSGTS